MECGLQATSFNNICLHLAETFAFSKINKETYTDEILQLLKTRFVDFLINASFSAMITSSGHVNILKKTFYFFVHEKIFQREASRVIIAQSHFRYDNQC